MWRKDEGNVALAVCEVVRCVWLCHLSLVQWRRRRGGASASSHGTSFGRGHAAARKQAGKHCLSCIRGISQRAYKLRAAGLAASVNTNVTARPHAPPAGCRLRETRGLLVLPETQRAACWRKPGGRSAVEVVVCSRETVGFCERLLLMCSHVGFVLQQGVYSSWVLTLSSGVDFVVLVSPPSLPFIFTCRLNLSHTPVSTVSSARFFIYSASCFWWYQKCKALGPESGVRPWVRARLGPRLFPISIPPAFIIFPSTISFLCHICCNYFFWQSSHFVGIHLVSSTLSKTLPRHFAACKLSHTVRCGLWFETVTCQKPWINHLTWSHLFLRFCNCRQLLLLYSGLDDQPLDDLTLIQKLAQK